jgi:hypothetical protein
VATIISGPACPAGEPADGAEPSKALEQLKKLIDDNKIPAIPGTSARVQYREGDGSRHF